MSERPRSRLPVVLANWTSLVGLVAAAGGFVAAGSLLALDVMSPVDNPYLGIFTYVVAPTVLVGGLALALLGAVLKSRRMRRGGADAVAPLPVLDLNRGRHVAVATGALTAGLCFVALSAIGSYRAYHFSESVAFCGTTCHSVMEPEHTAFQGSPHANVACTTCHIGPGADWFVKSKLNGLRQVWNTWRGTYPRPIPTPVHDLRPAKETCYTCHWPQKFFGSVLLERTYFRGNEASSPWTIAMLLKVGGGDREHGRAQGIHWHMAIENQIEYVAADEKRLEIPWVRSTNHATGEVKVFAVQDADEALTDEELAAATVRTMDCIDCHNRPSHQYHSPERALNEALLTGRLDRSLPAIKATASELLDGEYATAEEAREAIRAGLAEAYPDGGAAAEQAIAAVQGIYARNFFPAMKVSWREYPDHIGHMITPGCFRRHDGRHVSADGDVISDECESCHTILAQGPGTELPTITSTGLPFEHPTEDDDWKTSRCDECHEGLPVE